jgi:hypothetical protein
MIDTRPSFSTYPCRYNHLQAWNVFSKVIEGQIEDFLLEMDRIVGPLGTIFIRDKVFIVNQINKFLRASNWDSWWKENFRVASNALSYGDENRFLTITKMKSFHNPDAALTGLSKKQKVLANVQQQVSTNKH